MFRWLKRFFRNVIRKSTHVRQEPLNKVSIVILILIDIFVLINVFQGLYSISNFPLSPDETFPCYQTYHSYQNNTDPRKDLNLIEAQLVEYPPVRFTVDTENRMGEVSNQCDRLNKVEPEVKNPETLQLKAQIKILRERISRLNSDISTYKEQYNSTLAEKIAGQDPEQSINKTTADKTKADITKAEQDIKATQATLQQKEAELLAHPAAVAYLQELGDRPIYESLKKAYQTASFWYPNQQFALQALFLLPLILIGYLWHTNAVKNQRGTQALLSWHLLLIFCIPLLIKILEFLQFGNLFAIFVDFLVVLLGGVAFLASYVLILIIPLLGFGLIKFLQRFVFNPRVQAKGRIQKSRCIQCSSRLKKDDHFCRFCGFEQFESCPNCQTNVYKYTEFCHHCGTNLQVNLSDSLPK